METRYSFPGSEFSLDELAGIKSYAGRIRYCDRFLSKIASGSSRAVYAIGKNDVLKLAKNDKGLDQNGLESDAGMVKMYPEVMNAPIEYQEDNIWVTAKRLEPVTKKEIAAHFGVEWNDLANYFLDSSRLLTDRNCTKNPEYPEIKEGFSEEALSRFCSMMQDCEMIAGDFVRPSSWGRDPDNGKVMLIDFGLTLNVFEQHYSRNPQGAYGYGG